jgi:DNA repair protein RadC
MNMTRKTLYLKISEIPQEERPANKIVTYPNAMSYRELLALLIGGERQIELADNLYQACKGDIRRIGNDVSPEDLDGIGTATARRILAAIQLGGKLSSPDPLDRPVIHCPEDAADLVAYEMRALEQEELRVILLNTRNQVIGVDPVYRGSLNSSQIRIGELFKKAIRRNAAAIIMVHNHPSGSCSPSPCDLSISRAVVKAGKLLDIEVLDHLIIGHDSFISLNRRGLAFSDGSETEEEE